MFILVPVYSLFCFLGFSQKISVWLGSLVSCGHWFLEERTPVSCMASYHFSRVFYWPRRSLWTRQTCLGFPPSEMYCNVWPADADHLCNVRTKTTSRYPIIRQIAVECVWSVQHSDHLESCVVCRHHYTTNTSKQKKTSAEKQAKKKELDRAPQRWGALEASWSAVERKREKHGTCTHSNFQAKSTLFSILPTSASTFLEHLGSAVVLCQLLREIFGSSAAKCSIMLNG